MATCKACGSTFRKGTIAMLLMAGGLKGVCVCQTCAKGGALIVATKPWPLIIGKVDGDGEVRVGGRS